MPTGLTGKLDFMLKIQLLACQNLSAAFKGKLSFSMEFEDKREKLDIFGLCLLPVS